MERDITILGPIQGLLDKKLTGCLLEISADRDVWMPYHLKHLLRMNSSRAESFKVCFLFFFYIYTYKLRYNNKINFYILKLFLDKIKYIWTSGRLCDFKGCDRPDLQPLNINGWFWTAELQKLAPTTDRSQNDWSESGG